MLLAMKVKIVAVVFSFVALTALGGDRILSDGWQFSRDGASWRAVEVPHDWAIEGPFDDTAKDGDTGKLPWRGVGTYRRSFVVSARDAAGTVVFDFDGVMARPKVSVNGKLAGGWDYGYQSFRVDATPFVVPGTNLLEVVADTRQHRSRWYPGGGLNRKVVLRTMPKAHFVYNSRGHPRDALGIRGPEYFQLLPVQGVPGRKFHHDHRGGQPAAAAPDCQDPGN